MKNFPKPKKILYKALFYVRQKIVTGLTELLIYSRLINSLPRPNAYEKTFCEKGKLVFTIHFGTTGKKLKMRQVFKLFFKDQFLI